MQYTFLAGFKSQRFKIFVFPF